MVDFAYDRICLFSFLVDFERVSFKKDVLKIKNNGANCSIVFYLKKFLMTNDTLAGLSAKRRIK